MKRNHALIAFISLILATTAKTAYSASFDCRKASTEVEKQICEMPSLSKLDEQLNEAFKPLRDGNLFQKIQKKWITSVRDSCESFECLEEAYEQQVGFLTPLPEAPGFDDKNIAVLPSDKAYSIRDQVWRNLELFNLSFDKNRFTRDIVSAEYVAGKLHLIMFDAAFDSKDQCYKGDLYEYSDKTPIVSSVIHTIAKNICFDGSENPEGHDEGRRLAGVLDGTFYYRQQVSRTQLKGMAYTLGSRAEPKETSTLFQRDSNTTAFRKADLYFGQNGAHDRLMMYILQRDKSEVIADSTGSHGEWNIYNPIWSKQRPIFYFKDREAIWRANIADKTLSRIAQAEDGRRIQSPMPVELNGREALLYFEDGDVHVAIAPDY